MYLVIAAILFLATLTIDLVIDIRKWKREDYTVNHKKKWVRGFGLVPAAILLSWDNWWLLIPSPGLILFLYWLLFDGLYNLLRGFGWWYMGSDDEDDAETDNFLQRLPLWAHVTIKLGGFALFTTLYILCN